MPTTEDKNVKYDMKEMKDKKMEIKNKLKREECEKLVWKQKFEEMKEKNMKIKFYVLVLVLVIMFVIAFFSRFN